MLLHLLGLVEIILFAWGILQMKFTERKRNYLWAIALFVAVEIFYMLCPNKNIAVFVGIILGQMLSFVCLFAETLGMRIVKYWFSLLYEAVIYLPIQLIVSILGGKDGDSLVVVSDRHNISISILTCLTVLVLAYQIKKNNEWIEWIRSITVKYYILGGICAFCGQGIGEMVKEISATQSKSMQIFMWIMQFIVNMFLYGLGIIVAFSNLLQQQYKRESALKDEYLHMSKMHYLKLADHIREVRSIRHDLRAHINVLENYIEEQKWEQAKGYIKEMKGYQKYQNNIQVNVGNDLVNAVLIDVMQSDEENITLLCDGMLPKDLMISEYDLCTIFSNLISNSVEACTKLQEKEKRIVLRLKVFQENLTILMENPIEWNVPLENLGKFTSKSDENSHGYGIYNVKRAVEKYGGDVEFSIKDGKFQVKILLCQVIGSI